MNHSIQDGYCIITVQGNIALSFASTFQKEVLQLISQNKKHSLILDFFKVHTIDATALGFLLFCVKKLQAQSHSVSICGLSVKNQRLLEMSGIEAFFKTFPSVEQALSQ